MSDLRNLIVFYQDREIFDAVELPASWSLSNDKIDALVVDRVKKEVKKAYGEKDLVVEMIACQGEVTESMTVDEVAALGAFFVVQPKEPKTSITIHDLDKLKSLYKKALVVQDKKIEDVEAKWRAKVDKMQEQHKKELKDALAKAKKADGGGGGGGGGKATSGGGGGDSAEVARLNKINETLQDGVNARGAQIRKLNDKIRTLESAAAETGEALSEKEEEVERLKGLMGQAMNQVLSYWNEQVAACDQRFDAVAERLSKAAPSHKKKIASAMTGEKKHLKEVLKQFVAAAEQAAKTAMESDEYDYDYDEEEEEEEESDDDNNAGGGESTAAAAAGGGVAAVAIGGGKAKPAVKVEQSKFLTLRARSAMEAKFPNDIVAVGEKMATIWHKPMQNTAVYKDLCRLARRISVHVKDAPLTLSTATDKPLVVLAGIIGEVAKRLETKKRGKKIADAAAKFAANTDATGAPESALQRLFEDIVDLESKTATVFRCIHQGLIMPCTFWLKANTTILSKDVPSADGWRIEISIDGSATPGKVCVSHFRKEQSLSTDPLQFFMIEYRLRYILDQACSDLHASDVKFVRVDYDKNQIAKEVSSALSVLQEWNKNAF